MKKSKAVLIGIFVFIIVIAVGVGCIFAIEKNVTHDNIRKEWSRTELSGSKITTVKYTLTFTEDEIKYGKITLLTDDILQTYSYKVTGPNKIKINGGTYKISINRNKTMMTVTPGLTNGKESENWYYIQ